MTQLALNVGRDPQQTIVLSDGSLCRVEPLDPRTSLISREVDGRCVWGQVFATGEDHDAQVATVVEEMTQRPSDFRRWWL